MLTPFLSIFSISQAPDVDADGRLSIDGNLKKARLRVRVGLAVFAPLTMLFAALSATVNGLWWVAFTCGGPLLLLALTRKTSLAQLPIIVILLAFIPCVIWSFFESRFIWFAALIIFLYLWGFEEIISGFTLRHYIVGRQRGEPREEVEGIHIISKCRIWGYLLASATIGIVGVNDEGFVLVLLMLVALMIHTHFAMRVLYIFSPTRWIPHLVWLHPRGVNISIAVVMIFLTTYSVVLLLFTGDASAYGADLSRERIVQIDGEWWGDLLGYLLLLVTWVQAVFDRSWTDIVQRPERFAY